MPRQRGRPRSADVDLAVTRAVSELLVERGYAAMTIAQVASVAGVAKTAIYRRWASKAEMVFMVAIHGAAIEPPADLGTLHDDLLALAQHVITLLSTPQARHALPGLLADLRSDPQLAERFRDTFIRSERHVVEKLLERAHRRGELATRPDPADVHAQLLGTTFAWAFLLNEEPPADLAERITSALLAALRK
jgi:AcrR family transcriptional regulator